MKIKVREQKVDKLLQYISEVYISCLNISEVYISCSALVSTLVYKLQAFNLYSLQVVPVKNPLMFLDVQNRFDLKLSSIIMNLNILDFQCYCCLQYS